MFTSVRSKLGKSVLIAAVLSLSPVMYAQSRSVLPGSAAYDALPTAVTPALKSATSAARAQSFSTARIAENGPFKNGHMGAEYVPSRRNWMILSAVSSSAAAFDAYSTRRSLAAGNVEANPMMRPFADSPAIYGAIQASPLIMDLVAYKMQRSHNSFVRHMWWIPQTTGTAMSIMAGAHNMSISSR